MIYVFDEWTAVDGTWILGRRLIVRHCARRRSDVAGSYREVGNYYRSIRKGRHGIGWYGLMNWRKRRRLRSINRPLFRRAVFTSRLRLDVFPGLLPLTLNLFTELGWNFFCFAHKVPWTWISRSYSVRSIRHKPLGPNSRLTLNLQYNKSRMIRYATQNIVAWEYYLVGSYLA